MDSLKLASNVVHVADIRTCVLHPASATHRQLTDEQLVAAGIDGGMIRFSCGLENVEDILAEDDFDEEEAFPESGDVDVKVINKSEKEAVSEETVKSEDGFKPADNADTTEDNTETINLEEVK